MAHENSCYEKLMKVLLIQLYPTFCDPMVCSPPGYSVHGFLPGENTGVGGRALLQGISLTQGSKVPKN